MPEAVDVVVVAFGASDLLELCLDALEGRFSVVVVDNSSDEAVRSVSVAHGADYIDPGENLGFAGGVNVGIGHLPKTGGDVLLLNPDAVVTPEAIGQLGLCLHARSDLACAAPAQFDGKEEQPARVGWPFPTPLGAWVEAVGLGRLRRRVDFVIGSVLLMRASALAQVGPFDERFFLYAEETDWQRRARQLGWRVVLCDQVTATHVGAGTGGDPGSRDVHFHASQELYVRKHYGTGGWWIYRTGVMTGAVLRALVVPGHRGRAAAARFHLYRRGPHRVESQR
jgi:GT2 family glycosyltransferase